MTTLLGTLYYSIPGIVIGIVVGWVIERSVRAVIGRRALIRPVDLVKITALCCPASGAVGLFIAD
jgi:hypothetical protein